MKKRLLTTLLLSYALSVTADNNQTLQIPPEMQQKLQQAKDWYYSEEGKKKREQAKKAWDNYMQKNPQATGIGERVREQSQQYAKDNNVKNMKQRSNNAFQNYMQKRKQLQQEQKQGQSTTATP